MIAEVVGLCDDRTQNTPTRGKFWDLGATAGAVPVVQTSLQWVLSWDHSTTRQAEFRQLTGQPNPKMEALAGGCPPSSWSAKACARSRTVQALHQPNAIWRMVPSQVDNKPLADTTAPLLGLPAESADDGPPSPTAHVGRR